MKRNVMFKRFLPILLFVLGLCVTSTYAQDANTPTPTTDAAVDFVDEATALQNLFTEVLSLRSSLQSLTPGSAAYVDAMRRAEVFGKSTDALQAGETVQVAYAASINHLYNVIEAKEADMPVLFEIEQTLFNLTNN